MNITVIGPRVFIKPEKLPETTEDGKLHLVYDRQTHATMKGHVVAIGDGAEFCKRAANAAVDAFVEKCPVRVPLDLLEGVAELVKRDFQPEHIVRIGERVLFSPDSGEELIFEKDLLVCMREDDILAVIDEEEQ